MREREDGNPSDTCKPAHALFLEEAQSCVWKIKRGDERASGPLKKYNDVIPRRQTETVTILLTVCLASDSKPALEFEAEK